MLSSFPRYIGANLSTLIDFVVQVLVHLLDLCQRFYNVE